MNTRLILAILFSSIILTLASCASEQPRPAKTQAKYQSTELCKNCHEMIYKEYTQSMHSKSYSNPAFQAQYMKEIIPRALKDPAMKEEARQCLACHSPICYMTKEDPTLTKIDNEAHSHSGTCDFCHTINGISGDEPGDGNYISSPGDKKYGPHKTETNWHHIYSPLQSSSAFCGTCHNDTNHLGLEIKSTYTEWKESVFAQKRITCQDCHMSVLGFLSKETPIFRKGKAAGGASIISPPKREELHTHKFPGAYSTHQLSNAVKLDIKVNKTILSPGDKIKVKIRVDSRKSGHKLPTGSTDLRLLWIELSVRGNKDTFMVSSTALNPEKGSFDVVGMGRWDEAIVGDSVPNGSRVYRQIFLDASGNQTTSSHDAVKSIFDNRLEAASTRVEKYAFNMPKAKGRYIITATMSYLAYPKSFAKRFNLSEATRLEVATVYKEVFVE